MSAQRASPVHVSLRSERERGGGGGLRSDDDNHNDAKYNDPHDIYLSRSDDVGTAHVRRDSRPSTRVGGGGGDDPRRAATEQLDALLRHLRREIVRTRAMRDALLDDRDRALRDADEARAARDRALREAAIAAALARTARRGRRAGGGGYAKAADASPPTTSLVDDTLGGAGDDMLARRSVALSKVLADADTLDAVFP